MKKGIALIAVFLFFISTGLLAQVTISAADFVAESKSNKNLVFIGVFNNRAHIFRGSSIAAICICRRAAAAVAAAACKKKNQKCK